MHSNRYTLLFAAAVTIVASILLASAATFLKPLQDRNEALNVKKNILKAAGLVNEHSHKYSADEIEKMYAEKIREQIIDSKGNHLAVTLKELDPKDTGKFPIFFDVENGDTAAVIIPVSGKGLWSTIYGYIALKPDLNTVQGITFYKHGETPGLGGEIEKEWFTENFKDTEIFDATGVLVSITVAKGEAPKGAKHTVDGISGSTLTGNGINRFLKADLKKYQPWLERHRKELN
ncbi:MAG TPA: NADH:ubiquinone reductase (Na(+)-transporting) subunit C [Candidatus Marinimicrobia bacterium]|nr:NADH:ubiquinone reductase (Na(+)-transporting) subunit C [Candidatus Neomarinimicrobiota bacterium]